MVSLARKGPGRAVSVTSLPTVVDGEPRGVYGIVEYVTDRKRTEAALVKRNDHLAALHETAMEFMSRSGTEQMLSSIVSGAARLVGVRNVYAFLVEPGSEEIGARRRLLETGLAPEALDLEITESVVMDDAPATANILRELKDLGVRLSIDDFGTGYSSLSYLKRFPVDYLKVDRSFVDNIGQAGGSSEDAVIVGGIVSPARDLGLSVVAEGVETAEQLLKLKEMGCDLARGYYVSRPLPEDAMYEMLRSPRGAGGPGG